MHFHRMHRAALLLWRLSEGRALPAVLPMRVQKIPFMKNPEASTGLPRCAPEEMGIRSALIDRFIREVSADQNENLHSLTLLRHGAVIAEYSKPPYDRTIWHVTHSMCKTITALAIGILIGEGKLRMDERLLRIFSAYAAPAVRAQYEPLTVFHLLTMTSGVSFGEMQSVTETDWVRGFLQSPPLFRVGERFHYNSMNTYMLSAIVYAKTGQKLTEFLEDRLFRPMGIRQYYWETCPAGLEKGGWGLYLLQEDAAKLGQLVLNLGEWNGAQLVPRGFIRDMCAWHSDPPREISSLGYGYQCWLWKRPGSVRFSGLFGQHVLVVPDLDMVLVSNAGSGCMMGESHFLALCAEFFEQAARKEDATSGGRQDPFLRLHGRRYEITGGTARLLPLFLQVMENNYTKGISQIGFFCKDDKLYISLTEGETCNTFPVGFRQPEKAKLMFRGEEYLIAVTGAWSWSGNIPVLQVDIAFLEHANTRHLSIFLESEQRIRVKFSETPNQDALLKGIELLMGKGEDHFLLRQMQLKKRLTAMAEPELLFESKKTPAEKRKTVLPG